ncbi:MAG: hypothetical protein JNK64_20945 [Myxococcales bacterium]|nr:hypothetical protein [Myxococcales bacterium]
MSRPAPTATAWPSPYVTRRQLIAAGLASASALDRDELAGRLVRFGRRGGRGPVVYRVEDVERWLAGATGNAPAPAPLPAPVVRRRADGSTSDALAKIVEMGRGGRP